jgi:hypothetical protein
MWISGGVTRSNAIITPLPGRPAASCASDSASQEQAEVIKDPGDLLGLRQRIRGHDEGVGDGRAEQFLAEPEEGRTLVADEAPDRIERVDRRGSQALAEDRKPEPVVRVDVRYDDPFEGLFRPRAKSATALANTVKNCASKITSDPSG